MKLLLTKLLYSDEGEEMLRYLEIRATAFSSLAAFVQLILTCWLEGNLSSRKTPSILTCGSGFKMISTMHSDILHLSILLDANSINWNFDGFACKPFTKKHSMILSQSVSMFETTSRTHGEALDMELLSAWLYIEYLSTKLNMSSTKILKSKGSRIEPWGTPVFT